MLERVRSIDLGVEWEPNVPEAVMLTGDLGRAVLAINAHMDDIDQRAVVIVWAGARYRMMGGPNDEAISGHRLYNKGLRQVLWAGEVIESQLVKALERQNSVHSHHNPRRFANLVHHVILMKECTVEVVADSVSVHRIEGSTDIAATVAFLQ